MRSSSHARLAHARLRRSAIGPLPWGLALSLLVLTSNASAGEFDSNGEFSFSTNAIYQEGFEQQVPAGATRVAADALEGGAFARLTGAMVIELELTGKGRAVARAYARGPHEHVYLALGHTPESELASSNLPVLFPTGRVTSDGWYELKSPPFSYDAATLSVARFIVEPRGKDFEIDAVELVPEGNFAPQASCQAPDSASCGSGEVCAAGRCRVVSTPPLPDQGKDLLGAYLGSRLELFFGGVETRKRLPEAWAELNEMAQETEASAYWEHVIKAWNKLHDSHTYANLGYYPLVTLPACFVEGVGDLSQGQAPSDPKYPDVLVSHALSAMPDWQAGDRLVAVNGVHPVAFVESLSHRLPQTGSSDPNVFAASLDQLPVAIANYATSITRVRCTTGACSPAETIQVETLSSIRSFDAPLCDHRPAFHSSGQNPDAETHATTRDVYLDLAQESDSTEGIYSMLFNELPGSRPQEFDAAVKTIRDQASAVILDHRLGGGGSFAIAAKISEPFRPAEVLSVTVGPQVYVGKSVDVVAGLKIFNTWDSINGFSVGSANPKPGLKAAVLVSRDVSASDFFAYGMRGQLNVRSFGSRSDGAFSGYKALSLHGFFNLWFGYAETFTNQGQRLVGFGADPDEEVVPLQSDLVAGVDTAYVRALEWLRTCTDCGVGQ
ncbi:MAG: S41 family peptidase [Polyangiaceae bacterium]